MADNNKFSGKGKLDPMAKRAANAVSTNLNAGLPPTSKPLGPAKRFYPKNTK